jgi:hypothetical protein
MSNGRHCVSRDPTLRLEDIRTARAKIRRWTAGLDFARFVADDRTFDAAISKSSERPSSTFPTIFSGSIRKSPGGTSPRCATS